MIIRRAVTRSAATVDRLQARDCLDPFEQGDQAVSFGDTVVLFVEKGEAVFCLAQGKAPPMGTGSENPYLFGALARCSPACPDMAGRLLTPQRVNEVKFLKIETSHGR